MLAPIIEPDRGGIHTGHLDETVSVRWGAGDRGRLHPDRPANHHDRCQWYDRLHPRQSQGRLLTKATPEGTLTYTYDVAGNRLSMASWNPNGASAKHTYDELDRLKTVSSAGQSTNYAYDTVDSLSQTELRN